MFLRAWSQIDLSTPGQCATLAGEARGWTKLCAHCRRARVEKSALAKSQLGGKTRSCRRPGECAWLLSTIWLLPAWNFRTPMHRFPYISLDTTPPGKARTNGRRSAQRKRPFQYVRPAHSAGESFLCPGCPECALPGVTLLRQKPASGQARRDGSLALQAHVVPICLLGAWPQFTLS